MKMVNRSVHEPMPAKPVAPEFIDWRDFDPSWLPGGEHAPFAVEFVTYRDHLDELLKHKGKFVVISGKSIQGYYRDRRAALAAAHEVYGVLPVLVKQIVAMEPVRRPGNVTL
jgi:hypothetical protein